MAELRLWQRQAIDAFYAANPKDFLVSATPGAGKTTFALQLARKLLDEQTIFRVVVIVPTDALRQQWADAAAALNINLMPVTESGDYAKHGYKGCVATYAQIARGGGGELMQQAVAGRKTLAILDEIHHAGKERSWGDGLMLALEKALHRLSLTGTPWRREASSPIPFVKYNIDGRVVTDYAYEYGVAVADGVCRRIEFNAYDGEARWQDCGIEESATLGEDLEDEQVSATLDVIYEPEKQWMPTLLQQAIKTLDDLRKEIKDAAGLVVAERQNHARAYAALIENLGGGKPVVVLSDDPASKTAIEKFRTSKTKWIVAVRMVSEGVDIPRLGVGVYASKIRTPLFFRQVVGRFVRTRPNEEFNASLFIPAVPVLMRHAREIEEELRHQLEVEREGNAVERERNGGSQGSIPLDLRVALSTSEATYDRTIYSGDEVTPREMEQAIAWCRKWGIPTNYAVNRAQAFRAESFEPSVSASLVSLEALNAPIAGPIARHREERMLRQEIQSLVNKLAHRRRIEPKHQNAELIKRGFAPRMKASVEELRKLLAYLKKELAIT